ncbi:MAG: hypothetical protein J6V25_03900, partial [Oscillospiraceae bacterium]|nr:hypothetical protein [Oscillospiraceae bacterium]
SLLAKVSGETTFLSVTTPESAGSYLYKVQTLGDVAGYDSGLSSAYARVSVSVTAPVAPSVLSVNPAQQYPGGSAVLSFSGAEAGNNNAIVGYALWQSNLPESGYVKTKALLATATSGNFTVTAPQSGSIYFKVQTLGENLDGALSASYATLTADLSGTSDFTVTGTVDAGKEMKITLLSNTAKSHILTVSIGGYSKSEEVVAGASNATFIPPLEWLNTMPNSETATMKVSLETVGAGTIEKTALLRCPDDVGPIVSGAYAVRIDNEVPASWGVYVQGKSQAEIHLEQEAEMAYGSPIVSYRMEGAGGTAESAAVPFSMKTGLLKWGNIPITVTATDARGRTGSQQLILYVESYMLPLLKNMVSQRCNEDGIVQDEGVYGLAEAAMVVPDCGGNNKGVTAVSYRLQGSETWLAQGNLSDGSLIFGNGKLDIAKNYEIRYVITDSLGSETVYYDVITRAKPELHVKRGGGAWAFGGLADKEGALKVYGDLMLTGNLISSAEMAGKLLYVSTSGIVQPLSIGQGMYILDGVLQLGTPPGEGDAISSLAIGTEIYLMEDSLQPYILIAKDHHGAGTVTLIRKYATDEYSAFHYSAPSYEAANKYIGSTLESNHADFYQELPAETQGKILQVSIPVRTSASSSTIVETTAHMFPLSEMEYTGSGSAEGSAIAYCDSNAKRIAYSESGTARMTWTRSITGGMSNYCRRISESGSISSQGSTYSAYLRPACCVKSDMILTKDTEGRYIL